MVTLKSEPLEELASSTPPSVVKELERWKQVVFDFDMDHDQQKNSRNRQQSGSNNSVNNTRIPQPTDLNTDAALLAQLASSSGNLNQAYPSLLNAAAAYSSMAPNPAYYGNFLQHNPMAPHPTQLPPLSSLDFPWTPYGAHPHQQPQSQAGPSHYDLSHLASVHHSIPPTGSQPPATYWEPLFPVAPSVETNPAATSSSATAAAGTTSGAPRRGQSTSSGPHSSSSPEVDMTEAERQAISDEKRRRNTAASARFRIKKKHKTITLERSVSDLTGRAEELEREVADLRRENGWLKEIVMLKGTRFAASNLSSAEALSQVAALATNGPYSTDSRAQSSSSSGAARDKPQDQSHSESSDEASEEEETPSGKAKGKGKKVAKNNSSAN
ncbi:hypothetical protein CVT24_000489 [Panaeolus cyanescens]|uniref:BZIP domain-containing protein n=1 Tax=Panaeolus cyanescens TaxID=181874 RepID=A0A409VCL9_9AGAR|nr:hypothetical protein CVT24_000489 [Panaeolus cyanescens]